MLAVLMTVLRSYIQPYRPHNGSPTERKAINNTTIKPFIPSAW